MAGGCRGDLGVASSKISDFQNFCRCVDPVLKLGGTRWVTRVDLAGVDVRQAPNLKVVGSDPTPATSFSTLRDETAEIAD